LDRNIIPDTQDTMKKKQKNRKTRETYQVLYNGHHLLFITHKHTHTYTHTHTHTHTDKMTSNEIVFLF